MQILCSAPGPRAILSIGLKLKPGQIGTVDDELWADVRKRKVVAAWLASGELREIGASEANAAKEAGAKVIAAAPPEPVKETKKAAKAAGTGGGAA